MGKPRILRRAYVS